MMIIGIILVVTGCGILGWLIKESYINNKYKSKKYKTFYFIWVISSVILDTSGLIIIFGFIFLGLLLIIYF